MVEKDEVLPEGRAVSQTSTEHKYQFLEQSSSDFFYSLLRPHQTKCYGTLLSQEAATMIEREEGPWVCPLCKEPHLSTLTQPCTMNNTKINMEKEVVKIGQDIMHVYMW